jgi:hypothetical protein
MAVATERSSLGAQEIDRSRSTPSAGPAVGFGRCSGRAQGVYLQLLADPF